MARISDSSYRRPCYHRSRQTAIHNGHDSQWAHLTGTISMTRSGSIDSWNRQTYALDRPTNTCDGVLRSTGWGSHRGAVRDPRGGEGQGRPAHDERGRPPVCRGVDVTVTTCSASGWDRISPCRVLRSRHPGRDRGRPRSGAVASDVRITIRCGRPYRRIRLAISRSRHRPTQRACRCPDQPVSTRDPFVGSTGPRSA